MIAACAGPYQVAVKGRLQDAADVLRVRFADPGPRDAHPASAFPLGDLVQETPRRPVGGPPVGEGRVIALQRPGLRL